MAKRQLDEYDLQAMNEGEAMKGANRIRKPSTKRLRALENMSGRGDVILTNRKVRRIEKGKHHDGF